MNKLLFTKREQFRISIRNQEINKVLKQKRLPFQTQSSVLGAATEMGLHFQDVNEVTSYLQQTINGDEIRPERVKLLGIMLNWDIQIDFLNEDFIFKVLHLLYNSTSEIVDHVLRFLVNATYHYDWIQFLLVERNEMQNLLVVMAQNQKNQQLIGSGVKLLGNILHNNTQGHEQFFESFQSLTQMIDCQENVEELFNIIQNTNSTMLNFEVAALVLPWMEANKKQDHLIDMYYGFIRLLYERLQEEIFNVPGIVYEVVTDLKNIDDTTQLSNILRFTLELTYHTSDHTADLINKGLLQSLATRLAKDQDCFSDELYILGNLMIKTEYFLQGCALGILELLMEHLDRLISYPGYNSQETISSFVEFIETMASQLGAVAKREILKAKIDVHLVKLICSDFLDTQLIMYVIETLAKLWVDQVPVVEDRVKICLEKLLIDFPFHQATEELLQILEH